MYNVAIYCRLSVEDRNKNNAFEDSESIQNQKALLTRFAAEKNWPVYKIYSDEDYSGLDKDRPEFNQMIEDARGHKFEIVLCKSQSRFTRDMELVEKYLHNKFIEWGIRFISLTDNTDTAEKGNKKSRQINGLVNEWYCEDISEAIKASFKVKREAGKFIGSFAAYGYQKDATDKNKIIVDEAAAQVVREIYNWYLEGYGTQRIACKLNEQGIPNPTEYKKSIGLNFANSFKNDSCRLWNRTTVKRILKNQIYIGNMVQGTRKKVNYKSNRVIATRKSDWIIVENTHEPIIEKGTFDLVRERLKKCKRSSGEGVVHIFATRLYCMDCNNTMNKVTSSCGYVYVRCKTYAADPAKKLCTSHSMRLDELREAVTEQIRRYIDELDNESDMACKLQSGGVLYERIKQLESRSARIKNDLCGKERIFSSLYLDKLKGVISEQQFIDLNALFADEKCKLENYLEDTLKELSKLSEKANNPDYWVGIIRRYKGFSELSRTMVNELIDFIEVGEHNSKTGERLVKIHWQF